MDDLQWADVSSLDGRTIRVDGGAGRIEVIVPSDLTVDVDTHIAVVLNALDQPVSLDPLGLTADQLANTFTVYPSMSGSIAEAARRLHQA